MAIIFACAKISIRLFNPQRDAVRNRVIRRLTIDDALVWLALGFLIVLGVLYQRITPLMFELAHVLNKEEAPDSHFEERMTQYLKQQFAIIVLFWSCLWAVKGSFLAFYWPLFRRQIVAKRCWEAVLVFNILAYLLACILPQLYSCQPLSHYFKLGMLAILSHD